MRDKLQRRVVPPTYMPRKTSMESNERPAGNVPLSKAEALEKSFIFTNIDFVVIRTHAYTHTYRCAVPHLALVKCYKEDVKWYNAGTACEAEHKAFWDCYQKHRVCLRLLACDTHASGPCPFRVLST